MGWLFLTVLMGSFIIMNIFFTGILISRGFGISEIIFLFVAWMFSVIFFGISLNGWQTDRPFKITQDEILFGSTSMSPVKLKDIERMGWLSSRNEERRFLIIKVKRLKYIIGERPCKHVTQPIDDVTAVGDVLVKLTGKRIDEDVDTKEWFYKKEK